MGDFITEYVKPQENANHTGVRWLALRDRSGNGLQFVGAAPLSTSVWPYTQAALASAMHPNEIEPLDGALTVNIDAAQAGLGGSDSWSMRAIPLPQYRLLGKRYEYSFKIVPVTKRSDLVNNGRMLKR